MSTFRFPKLQLQLDPRDQWGRYNCAAYSAAMAGDADSRGRLVYTGKQVRAATNEPTPDPRSPGLTLQQVDAALYKLSAGRINLDVRPAGSSFLPVPNALRAGKWAILSVWRGVLVDAGLGYSSTFRGGHAILIGYDQVRRKAGYFDPLVGHWIDAPWALLSRATDQLMHVWGYESGAYYALTRDVYDVGDSLLRYSAIFDAGNLWVYDITGGVVTREVEHLDSPSSAPCTAPELFVFNGSERKLVRLIKGVFEGRWVEPGSTHVTLAVKKA